MSSPFFFLPPFSLSGVEGGGKAQPQSQNDHPG